MLALHYYSDSESVRAALRQVAAAWWSQDNDPVYSKDLIKEFEVEDPPLEDELAWILSKGIRRHKKKKRKKNANVSKLSRASGRNIMKRNR